MLTAFSEGVCHAQKPGHMVWAGYYAGKTGLKLMLVDCPVLRFWVILLVQSCVKR